jgi:predicted RNA binding protein YcfA (HicA-like mRNA interferase family)
MAIDYRDLRSLTARELIGALTRDGFYFVRQKGSHQRFRHPDGRRVTVAPQRRNLQRENSEVYDRESSPVDRGRPQAPQSYSLALWADSSGAMAVREVAAIALLRHFEDEFVHTS